MSSLIKMSGYGSAMTNWPGNRGLGFNRATWELGNSIGRAGQPYIRRVGRIAQSTINSFGSRLSSAMSRQAASRSSQITSKRSLRGNKTSRGTQTPRPSNRGVQKATFGGDSGSSCYIVAPGGIPCPGKKMLGRGTTVVNNFKRVTSLTGKQNMVLLTAYFDPAADLLGIFNNIQAVGTVVSQKYYLHDMKGKVFITNQHNNNGRMTIYDCVARLDSNAAAVTDPAQVFLAGSVDSSGGLAVDALVPGFSPFANPRFVENYKVLKTTDVILAPGATHVHNVSITINKIINHERFVNDAYQIAKLTHFSVALIHGSPSNDSVTKTSATTTLGTSTFDIVAIKEYAAKGMLLDYSSTTATNSLPVTFAVSEDIMGEDGNVIVGADG